MCIRDSYNSYYELHRLNAELTGNNSEKFGGALGGTAENSNKNQKEKDRNESGNVLIVNEPIINFTKLI